MVWYAIDSVDDAIDATRSFLFPVRLRPWLVLALITFFLGGSGGSSFFNVFNVIPTGPEPTLEPTPEPPTNGPQSIEALWTAIQNVVPWLELWMVAVFAVALALFGLALAVLSELLRFVLYDSLERGTASLRAPVRRRFGQALRLFGFKLLLQFAASIPFIALVAAFVFSPDPAALWDSIGVAGFIVAALAAVVIWLVYTLVLRGTNEFVVPIMVLTDSGVLAGWKRFWPVLVGQLSQFGVYVVVHFLVLLAIGIGQLFVAAIIYGIVLSTAGLVAVALVLGVFGGPTAVLASPVAIVAIAGVVAMALLVGFVLMLPIRIVTLTYVATYEVSVLAAADEALRLFPEGDAPIGDEPTDRTHSP